MDMNMHRLKQFIFGTYNCNCNRKRKDNLHNINCASWKNAWRWKSYQKKLINQEQLSKERK